VSVFTHPPATFNVPALVVQLPTQVDFSKPTVATDTGQMTVLAAVGIDQADALDQLLQSATAALDPDPTLGGAVILCMATDWHGWRILNLGGSEYLVAEVALQIRM
jgi:hypothetical protein